MRTVRLIAALVLLSAMRLAAQGVLSPSLLRQAGATDTQVLCWSDANSRWQPCDQTGGGASALDDLTDVTITAASSGEVLKYNGSAWVDATLAITDLSDVTAISGNTTTVATTSGTLTSGDCVEFDASGNLVAAGAACGSGGASALDDLTDVTITTVASGNLLRYNGSAWVNTTLGTGDLPSGATLDAEWDTIAEIETATSANIIVSTEADTLAELDTLVADVTLANLVYSTSTFGTDNAIVRADSTARNVQASSATIDDSGNISTAGSITAGAGGGGTGSIAGAAGSTTITGGTGAGDDLIFATTSNVTKGSYRFSELDCSGNANGGALTADASGNITCTDDDGSASLAFSALTGATNTSAAMVVGTGASLSASGSGTIAATTAAALAANPADCTSGQFANAIAANGDLTCASPSGGAGDPNYTESFTTATSVSMTNAEHGYGHANLLVQCFDNSTPKQQIIPASVTVNTSTYEVIATFSPAATGSCTVNGSGTTITETNALETDGASGIADTEVFIGTGAGTGNYAALSGDATMANTGAVTLATGITRDTEWDTASEINAATTDDDFVTLTGAETLATGTKTVTAKFDFGGGTLEVPNSITLPATCAVGDFYMDTDATSGQRMYACESTNTWVQQGGGAETNALEGDGASGIADTEIFIGTGSGTGNYAAVSGDATLANTGALTIATDAVTLAKLNDAANTPTANDFVAVDTGATGVKYVTPNAGTDVTADLEEETHASEHAENAADELLVEGLGTACTSGQVAASDGAGGLDCTTLSSGGDGSPNYTESFTSATSVSMTNAEHGFGHANLIVECYDNASPKAKIEPASVTVNTSTYEVVASFSPAASGSCTINGAGNAATWYAPVAFASIPSCSTIAFFQPLTDSFYDYAYCDGSSTLHYYVGGFEATPPPSSGWSWVNQGSSTITTTKGTQVMAIPASASNSNRVRVRSIPSAPYTVTIGFSYMGDFASGTGPDAGLVLRNNAGGTLSFYAVTSNDVEVFSNKWSSPTAFASGYTMSPTAQALGNAQRVLLRIADNSTNRIFSISHDMGLTWTQMLSVTNTDYHTPDEIGFFMNVVNSDPATITVWHWLEE